MIKRDFYLDQIKDRMWDGNVKVITGIRRGFSVDVGVVKDRKGDSGKTKEIDFVVNNVDKRVYIQSALRIDEREKSDPEIGSLKLTGDFFKKIVVRNDIPATFYDEDGIMHMSLTDLLLDRVNLF